MTFSKTFWITVSGAIVVAALVGSFWWGTHYNNRNDTSSSNTSQTSLTTKQNPAPNKQNCLSDTCLRDSNLTYPVGTLPQNVQDALARALQEEYLARDTYQAVIDQYGYQRPFSMIIRSEEQHVSSIKALYDKYGLTIPASTAKPTVPGTFKAACELGVSVEKADIALYDDDVLKVVGAYPDMVTVFTNLRDASKLHLAAFEKCN